MAFFGSKETIVWLVKIWFGKRRKGVKAREKEPSCERKKSNDLNFRLVRQLDFRVSVIRRIFSIKKDTKLWENGNFYAIHSESLHHSGSMTEAYIFVVNLTTKDSFNDEVWQISAEFFWGVLICNMSRSSSIYQNANFSEFDLEMKKHWFLQVIVKSFVVIFASQKPYN